MKGTSRAKGRASSLSSKLGCTTQRLYAALLCALACLLIIPVALLNVLSSSARGKTILSDLTFVLSTTPLLYLSSCKLITPVPLVFMSSHEAINIVVELAKGTCEPSDTLVSVIVTPADSSQILTPQQPSDGADNASRPVHRFRGASGSWLSEANGMDGLETEARRGEGLAGHVFMAIVHPSHITEDPSSNDSMSVVIRAVVLVRQRDGEYLEVSSSEAVPCRLPPAFRRAASDGEDQQEEGAPSNPHAAVGSLRVALVSDSQSGAPVFRSLLSSIAALRPDILVHGGDATNEGDDAREAYMYLQAPLMDFYSELGYAIPVALVKGNHDGPHRYAAYQAGHNYYDMQLGPVRLLVLDSEDRSGAQVAWLEETCVCLPSSQPPSRTKVTILLMHVPPVVEYWNPVSWAAGDSTWHEYSRDTLLPRVACCAVGPAILVSGHSHLYQRGSVSTPTGGLKVAIIGGGGGALESAEERVATSDAFSVTHFTHHFALLDVRADSVTQSALWQAIDVKGGVLDEVELFR